jgi:hypothetical protein
MPIKTKKAAKPTAPNPHHYVTIDPAAAYKHFLPLVQALPEATLRLCNIDVEIARHNIDRAITALEPHLAAVRKKLPAAPIPEILELPALGLALVFADDLILPQANRRAIKDRLALLRPLRDRALRQLEILAELDFVPEARVRAIRMGNGSIDSARDAIAIPALYEEYAAKLVNKHPITVESLAELREHGQWLLPQLKPKGAVDAPSERDPASVIRDRFWTLIGDRYDLAREAGVAAFGLKHLDEQMPPLGSRSVQSAPKPAAAPVMPA